MTNEKITAVHILLVRNILMRFVLAQIAIVSQPSEKLLFTYLVAILSDNLRQVVNVDIAIRTTNHSLAKDGVRLVLALLIL